jgi:hypothetical protein
MGCPVLKAMILPSNPLVVADLGATSIPENTCFPRIAKAPASIEVLAFPTANTLIRVGIGVENPSTDNLLPLNLK